MGKLKLGRAEQELFVAIGPTIVDTYGDRHVTISVFEQHPVFTNIMMVASGSMSGLLDVDRRGDDILVGFSIEEITMGLAKK